MSGVERPRPAADDGAPRRVAPVYAVTGDLARSAGLELPIESLITGRAVSGAVTTWTSTGPSSNRRAGRCPGRDRRRAQVPVAVARVLLTELVDAGYLDVHTRHRRSPGEGRARGSADHAPGRATGLLAVGQPITARSRRRRRPSRRVAADLGTYRD